MNVDYKAMYYTVQRQIGDLSLMVDKYQREIIPQYEKLLEMARAERDAALEQLKRLTACYSCKHKQENCDSQRCHGGYKLWEWAGPQEVNRDV